MSLEKDMSYTVGRKSFESDIRTLVEVPKKRRSGCFSCLSLPLLWVSTNSQVANSAPTVIQEDKSFELPERLATHTSSSASETAPPATSRPETPLDPTPVEDTYNGYRILKCIPQEKSSKTRGPSTALHIKNGFDSQTKVGVWWINYQGDPIYYKTLKPGKGYRQQTYEGHVWRLTDGPADGKVFGIWRGAQDETAIVVDEKIVRSNDLSDDWTLADTDSVIDISSEYDVDTESEFSMNDFKVLTPMDKERDSERYPDGETAIQFINSLDCQVSVYWIDWNGKPVHYTDIEPRQKMFQHTYEGHVWRVTKGSPDAEKIGNWVGDKERGVVHIGKT